MTTIITAIRRCFIRISHAVLAEDGGAGGAALQSFPSSFDTATDLHIRSISNK